MDAPAPQEDLGAFVHVDQHLAGLGLRVPRLLGVDLGVGLALLEDLGDATFTAVLADDPSAEEGLYTLALDVLLALNRHPAACAIELPPYDIEALLSEAALLVDWFLPQYGRPLQSAAKADYHAAWRSALADVATARSALVLRDFHVDNLMRLDQALGTDACALLDFQDARLGHPAYDLASLLEDARRDLPEPLRQRLYRRFVDALKFGAAFDRAYTVLAAQRHAKVLGIFVRLYRRDGKALYLRHLPRVAALLRRHLDAPELAPVHAWFEVNVAEIFSSIDWSRMRPPD